VGRDTACSLRGFFASNLFFGEKWDAARYICVVGALSHTLSVHSSGIWLFQHVGEAARSTILAKRDDPTA